MRWWPVTSSLRLLGRSGHNIPRDHLSESARERRGVEEGLRSLPQDRQRLVAVRLAEILEPLGDLVPLTPEPLTVFAEQIRSATRPSISAGVAARLRSIPALQEDEEPPGSAWFALGAVVAWIYAAETMTDAAGEPVIDAFRRVEDVLDSAGEELAIGGLLERLHRALLDAIAGDDSALRALRAEGESIASRLRDTG